MYWRFYSLRNIVSTKSINLSLKEFVENIEFRVVSRLFSETHLCLRAQNLSDLRHQIDKDDVLEFSMLHL